MVGLKVFLPEGSVGTDLTAITAALHFFLPAGLHAIKGNGIVQDVGTVLLIALHCRGLSPLIKHAKLWETYLMGDLPTPFYLGGYE